MTMPIVFRPDVAPEVDAVYAWYESEREGLGLEFLDELAQAYEAIAEFPDGPAPLYRDVRVRAIHRFPYGVYYRVLPAEILVVAVVHHRRGMKSWKSRAGAS